MSVWDTLFPDGPYTYIILSPLPEDYPVEDLQLLTPEYAAVGDFLESNGTPSANYTFEEYLHSLYLTVGRDLLVILSPLSKEKIFLYRQPCDIYFNPLSEKIFKRQRATMDIQFVLDVFACCTYIVGYINETDRGMSSMPERVFQEKRN